MSKPGLYKNIPLAAYHGDIADGWSVSTAGLKALVSDSGAPADYCLHCPRTPKRKPSPDSSDMIMGRAIHHLVLGEPHFQLAFAEQPDTYEDEKTGEIKKWNGNANACKRWDAARAKEGKYILTKSEVQAIRGIAIAL